MDESKHLEEIRNWEHLPYLIRPRPIRGESNIDFLGESEGSLPQPQDSLLDAGKARNDFWSHVRKLQKPPSRWTQSQTLLAERRIIPYSTEIHWRIQNYSHEFGCQAREAHRWLLEYRWVSRLVRSLDRFHTIYSIGRRTSRRIYVVRGRLTRKQLTSRPDHPLPELWKSIGKHAKLKEKQKWSNPKLHLENARKLRGIYFIDPEDKEFKETIKNARKKLESSVAPAMPFKIVLLWEWWIQQN